MSSSYNFIPMRRNTYLTPLPLQKVPSHSNNNNNSANTNGTTTTTISSSSSSSTSIMHRRQQQPQQHSLHNNNKNNNKINNDVIPLTNAEEGIPRTHPHHSRASGDGVTSTTRHRGRSPAPMGTAVVVSSSSATTTTTAAAAAIPIRGRSPCATTEYSSSSTSNDGRRLRRGRSPLPLQMMGMGSSSTSVTNGSHNASSSMTTRCRSPGITTTTSGTAATQCHFSLNRRHSPQPPPPSSRRSRLLRSGYYHDIQSLCGLVCLATLVLSTIFYKVKYDATHETLRVAKRDMTRTLSDCATTARELDVVTKARDRYEKEVERKSSLMANYNDRIEDLNVARNSLAKENRVLKQQIELLEASKVTEDEIKGLRDNAIKENTVVLQRRIQRESHREIREKFGVGPYKVKFEVQLSPTEAKTSAFIVKCASTDLMPHAVHLFLEQVHHKLWDGCLFLVNAPHVMQAGPYRADGKKNSDVLLQFQQLELDTVSFQEYSDAYPHKMYTLGFAGRPGGPDFYLNKVDNSEYHGPGGQDWHILDEEADPCFAEVVAGFDVVDGMFQRDADEKYMMEPVRIVSARIVNDRYAEVERRKYQQLKVLYGEEGERYRGTEARYNIDGRHANNMRIDNT